MLGLFRRQGGQTTSEYLVIAGIVVAILLAIGVTFKSQITSATSTLMGNVTKGAAGTVGS